MTRTLIFTMVLMFATAGVCSAQGSSQIYRDQTDASKMMHKLGRGLVNIVTCWVEVPRNVAIEWERTDAVSGLIVGTVKGMGWGFSRLATGVFDTVTFPFPVPADYQAMMSPEFIVEDIWDSGFPLVTDYSSNDPAYPKDRPVHANSFNF